jgi:hypothetical protein
MTPKPPRAILRLQLLGAACKKYTVGSIISFVGRKEKMKFIIAAVLIIHGLIVAAQSSGSFGSTPPPALQNPAWVSWWPSSMGRSWLAAMLGMDDAVIFYRVGGLLWLAGGLLLVAAGMGAVGFIVPVEWCRSLAVAGGAVSLLMLVIYLHPILTIGTGLSIAILVALHWADWPSLILAP